MSYFRRPDAPLHEQAPAEDHPRSPFAEVAGRFANWITGVEQMPPGEDLSGDESPDLFAQLTGDHRQARRRERPAARTAERRPSRPAPWMADLPPEEPVAEPTTAARQRPEALASAAAPQAEPQPDPEHEADDSGRFPMAPLGYNRTAVDEHLAQLERELTELRASRKPKPSITEELERIGEQTASILVVAHDQANETTRLAEEQAERCVADAAANAVAMTTEAKERLRELDSETDAVWRERERLLEDVRSVSAALATLADQASDRFPAAEPPAATMAFPVAHEMAAPMAPEMAGPMAPEFDEPASPTEDDPDVAEPTQPGDTGSWLVGLEPSEPQPE